MKNLCAIIPAAGQGTRLGYDKPKILYDFGGLRPLDIFHRALHKIVAKTIFVVSPQGAPLIKEELDRLKWDALLAIQEIPLGMGHAVFCAKEKAASYPLSMIIWGDQISVDKSILQKTLSWYLKARQKPWLTLPVVKVKNPYISLEWDVQGNLTKVLQKRENDLMPQSGFNDCGIFLVETKPVFDLLEDAWQKFCAENNPPKMEFNFLPILPRMGDKVLAFNLKDEKWSRGLNSKEDADYFKEQLSKNNGHA